eukprot:353223-Chlamydomonas_euryale.AAC.2
MMVTWRRKAFGALTRGCSCWSVRLLVSGRAQRSAGTTETGYSMALVLMLLGRRSASDRSLKGHQQMENGWMTPFNPLDWRRLSRLCLSHKHHTHTFCCDS